MSLWRTWVVVAALVIGLVAGTVVYYLVAQPSITITCATSHGQHAPVYIEINGQRLVCQ
jgi:hypothetical protein